MSNPTTIASSALEESSTATSEAASALKRQGVYSIADMLSIRPRADSREYLIDGLVGLRQIILLAGDSGIGKSPFLYQVSLSVAAGVDCLGLPTKQAAVLYMDFENWRDDAGVDIVQPMLGALNLTEQPEHFDAWHYLDSPPNADPCTILQQWLALPDHAGLPKMIVIDPYEAWPGASIKNDDVRRVLAQFRRMQKQYPLSVWLPHHINKEPTRQIDRANMPELASDPRHWIERARGGKALINVSDVRLGVEETNEDGLLIAGFRRGKGLVGPIQVLRRFNEAGDATHYSRVSSIERAMANPARRDEVEKFKTLPDPFTTADVKQVFGYTHNEQTNRLLKRWRGEGLARHVRRGTWAKAPDEYA